MLRRNYPSEAAVAGSICATICALIAFLLPVQASALGAVVYDSNGSVDEANRVDAAIWVSREHATVTVRPAYSGRSSKVYVQLVVPEGVSTVYTLEDNGQFQRLHNLTSPRREYWEFTGECVRDVDEALLQKDESELGKRKESPSYQGTEVGYIYRPTTNSEVGEKLQSLRGKETDLARFSGSSRQNTFFLEVDTRRSSRGGRELPLIQFQLPISALGSPAFGGLGGDTDLRVWFFDVSKRWQAAEGTNAVFAQVPFEDPRKSWEERYARMHQGLQRLSNLSVTEFSARLDETQLADLRDMHRPGDLRYPDEFTVTRLYIHRASSLLSFETGTSLRDTSARELATGEESSVDLEFGVREDDYRLREIVARSERDQDCGYGKYAQWRRERVEMLPFDAPAELEREDQVDLQKECKAQGYPCSAEEASDEVVERTEFMKFTTNMHSHDPERPRRVYRSLKESDDVAEVRTQDGWVQVRFKGGYWVTLGHVRLPPKRPEYLIDIDERVRGWNKEVHGEDTVRTAKLKSLDVVEKALEKAAAISDAPPSASKNQNNPVHEKSAAPQSGCSQLRSGARSNEGVVGWVLLSLLGMAACLRRLRPPRDHE